MAYKPILFNTDMVKAILEGRKTQTRRLIRPHFRENEYGFQIITELHSGRHFVVVPKHGKGFVKPRKMRMPFPIYIDENGKHSVTPPKIEKEAP